MFLWSWCRCPLGCRRSQLCSADKRCYKFPPGWRGRRPWGSSGVIQTLGGNSGFLGLALLLPARLWRAPDMSLTDIWQQVETLRLELSTCFSPWRLLRLQRHILRLFSDRLCVIPSRWSTKHMQRGGATEVGAFSSNLKCIAAFCCSRKRSQGSVCHGGCFEPWCGRSFSGLFPLSRRLFS